MPRSHPTSPEIAAAIAPALALDHVHGMAVGRHLGRKGFDRYHFSDDDENARRRNTRERVEPIDAVRPVLDALYWGRHASLVVTGHRTPSNARRARLHRVTVTGWGDDLRPGSLELLLMLAPPALRRRRGESDTERALRSRRHMLVDARRQVEALADIQRRRIAQAHDRGLSMPAAPMDIDHMVIDADAVRMLIDIAGSKAAAHTLIRNEILRSDRHDLGRVRLDGDVVQILLQLNPPRLGLDDFDDPSLFGNGSLLQLPRTSLPVKPRAGTMLAQMPASFCFKHLEFRANLPESVRMLLPGKPVSALVSGTSFDQRIILECEQHGCVLSIGIEPNPVTIGRAFDRND